MNGVTSNESNIVYDSVISFGERGSIAGNVVRFEHIAEGTALANSLVQLSDVLLSPFNL